MDKNPDASTVRGTNDQNCGEHAPGSGTTPRTTMDDGMTTGEGDDAQRLFAEERPRQEERRDRRGDGKAPHRPNDEVPANRREDPRTESRDEDVERKDRRSS